jgi:cytoskeletal protein RodZ
VDETTRRRPEQRRMRHRSRVAVGTLAVGLVVLVGCATTIDGRAVAGETAVTTSSAGTTTGDSDTSDTSDTSSSADSSDATDTSDGTDPSEPTSSESTGSSTATGTSTGGGGTGTSSSTAAPTSTGPSSTATTSTSSTTTSTDSTTFTGNPDNLPLTPAGTALTYGQSAQLPVSYAGAQAVMEVSNLTVTKGSEADWAALGVDVSDAQGEEPWFLRMTLTQKSEGDMTYTAFQDDLWVYSPDGDPVSTTYPDDDANTLCPIAYAPEDFGVGKSYDACVVLSVNLGESVDRVQFEGGYEEDDPYVENPVVWKG